MNERQRYVLSLRETDVQGTLRRLYGDEQLYNTCLTAFLDDPTMGALRAAVAASAWDEAFTAAHALKGVAGNMGFVPLMHAIGQLVVLIRGGRVRDLEEAMEQVNSCYRDITDAIRQYLACADDHGTKGESL